MVPKMLSPLVKDWAPKAFVISFKLETDPSILLERARRALETYNHQAVVANVLDTRRGYVVVVTKDTQQELVLTDEEVQKDGEIEDRIVSNLTKAHSQFMSQEVWKACCDSVGSRQIWDQFLLYCNKYGSNLNRERDPKNIYLFVLQKKWHL